MKVLIQSYNTWCQNPTGGVNRRIRKTVELLSQRIDATYFNQFETMLSEHDILHIFGTQPENYDLVACAKRMGLKVVVSSILNARYAKKIWLNTHLLNHLPMMTGYKRNELIYRMADLVIAETEAERHMVSRCYRVPEKKIVVISNGVDIAPQNGGDEIYAAIGGKKPYILQVGRFDRNKNQLNVIRAMSQAPIDVVLIGGADHSRDAGYMEACRSAAEGSERMHFLGWQKPDSPMLQSAYAHAEVVVLPSFNETFGLTLLEGGMAGAKLALSKTLPILGYDAFSGCRTFAPDKPEQIREQLLAAVNDPRDPGLKQRLIQTFSWDAVIEEHIRQYERILEKNCG